MHRNRRNVWLARSALVLGLWGVVTAAEAVGLGKMTVLSALDEPLRAEIELTAASPAELKKLNAGLAPRAEFENAGIDRPPHLGDIKYSVVTRSDGRSVLKLSTDQPVREPFLHFLLQLEWAGGRLVREYTALLDPPHLLAAQPDPIEAPRAEPPSLAQDPPAAETAVAPPANDAVSDRPAVSSPATSRPQDDELYGPDSTADAPKTELVTPTPSAAEASDTTNAAVSAAPNGAPNTVDQVPAASTYGPIKRGETLSTIVRRLPRDSSISAEQTMLALLKHNKSAFIANNVNNLRTGKVLKIPAATEMSAISSSQAVRDFRAQYNSWQEYKLKLANTAQMVKQPVGDGASVKGEIAEKPPASTASATTDSTPAKGANTELLKIVRPNSDASAKGNTEGGGRAERQALSEKVSTLEEVISSKELENKELRERVTQLESQIKNTKRLMEIESKDLAKAQNQASKPAVAPNAGTAKTPAGADEKAKAPSETKPTVDAVPPVAASNPAEPPKTATAPPTTTPVAAPTPEPDLWSSIMGNPLLVPVGGALLAVLVGGFLIYYRRRRRALAEFGESILSGGLNMNSEGTPANPADANAGEVSFLSDFSQGGMGNIHTDEVDPIAEAEVYLAYGRDEQAEEILKEAVIKDPARHELRLKLLEIYHQRNDVGAFETVAEELYAALEGKGGKIWESVEEMGYKMNPDNPMFRAGAQRAGTALLAAAPVAAMSDADMSFDMPKSGIDDSGLNFSEGSTPSATSSADGGPGEFSFDLDFSAADTSAANFDSANAAASPIADQPVASDTGIDFDFSSFALEDNVAPSGGEANSPDGNAALDFSSDELTAPSLDNELAFETSLDDNGGADATDLTGDDAQIDETATKLDLAKAYIDMGDADGARSILDEVLAEGNDSQRQQAAALAAQIAA